MNEDIRSERHVSPNITTIVSKYIVDVSLRALTAMQLYGAFRGADYISSDKNLFHGIGTIALGVLFAEITNQKRIDIIDSLSSDQSLEVHTEQASQANMNEVGTDTEIDQLVDTASTTTGYGLGIDFAAISERTDNSSFAPV